MTRRYYVPDLPGDGGVIQLPGTESHHAAHVMRVKTGDSIELFDGRGGQAQAIVASVGRGEVSCDAQPSQIVDVEPARPVHLAIALPKQDRARELIERLTELGVQSVTPLVATRTQRAPSESLLEKLRRGVIEACKQSGRNHLMRIETPNQSGEYFRSNGATDTERWIAHPMATAARLSQMPGSGQVIGAIGPEGGWTGDELQAAIDAGFSPVDLGKRIYRVETAATVMAAILVSD